MPMPLPRSTALRVLRERALPTVRIRTLSTTPTATASHAAPDTTTTTAADGTWKFVAGKRILITPGSIRTRFESKERKLLADRELATAPQPDVVVPSVSSTTLTEGMSDDVDEGIGMAGLDSSGEGAEPFAGYQRLQKGDLCELRTSSGIDMGIFLRETPGASTGDFLTPQGMVKQGHTARIAFALQNFLPAETVDTFVAYYEKVEKFEALRGTVDQFQGVVSSRDVSMPLLEPVREFVLEAKNLHADRYRELEGLYQKLAHETEIRRVTTSEAATMVFGDDLGSAEIYATHIALMGDGLRYVGDKGFHRITSKFRVRSKKDLEMVDSVTEWVRKSSVVFDARGYGNKAEGPMKDFIQRAKYLIDLSRSLRKAKPEQPGVQVERVELPEMQWTPTDRKFIDFMKARMKSWGLQHTPIDGLVPYVLRETRRYQGKKLDGSCTYDFLTEIGAFSPWENMTLQQDNQNIPGYGMSQQADIDEARLTTLKESSFGDLNLTDCMAGQRKDWGDTKVFCVDDASALEIDDGMSIEKVSGTESWIHVHIANPTAFLGPEHWISQIAEHRATTKYLDPHVFRMLPKLISDALGVRPGGAVLTFSTKINTDTGDILDYHIEPGTVHNVHRVTYDELGKLLAIKPAPKRILTTGDMPTPTTSGQNAATKLTKNDRADLEHLQKCYLALTRRRVRDGMISLLNVNYDYSISQEAATVSTGADLVAANPILYRGYPSIKVTIDKEPQLHGPGGMVAEFMILANTILAQYAQKHQIPMPYRTLQYNPARPDLVHKFTHEIMPTRDEYGVAARSVLDDLSTYMSVGFSRLTVEPGPHKLLGLPMGYVKATSPLRRYSDMIAHWNIQAHLLSQPLPFPQPTLTAALPSVDLKERMANFGTNETRRFWGTACIHRLLMNRTEMKRQLPKLMTMTLTEQKMWPTPSVGFVEELACMAKVAFASKKESSAFNVGDKIAAIVEEARLGERAVLFKNAGLVKRYAA
ncbi:hypothetical protein BZA05DRAFT_476695 [Tricharina praecox]|uniref:uncharacterized protein n=1 Tax=Tricharina praecox TaxID=43433 RepID=UPI00221F6938|nr:uncharacterized protein BZA05DRAFT_476695 [Tricharina praecox]KAI5844923.1 hypothetical protein BZA05DRAFT_476695 [Tricharina praecox]